MRTVIQRALGARVYIDGGLYSEIPRGLLILAGVSKNDEPDDIKYMARKCAGLRIFEDAQGKMNLSVSDVGGELLIVSNFTLYGDCSHGRRPNFTAAENTPRAEELFEAFIMECRELGLTVKTGSFGADMKVELTNDGPVTIIMDTEEMRKNDGKKE